MTEISTVPEAIPTPETSGENPIVIKTIRRELLRHETQVAKAPSGLDDDRYLTPEGALHGAMVSPHSGFEEEQVTPQYRSKIDRLVASPAIRAAKTALLRGLGEKAFSDEGDLREDLKPSEDEKYEDLVAVVDGRLVKDTRLAFNIGDRTEGYGKAFLDAANGKRLVPFLLNESDQAVAAAGDPALDCYSTFAAHIAEIVKEDLVEVFTDKVKRGELVERSMDPVVVENRWIPTATHAGVTESFLLKLIALVAKRKGQDPSVAQQKFLNAIDNNSFGFSEKIEVVSTNYGNLRKSTINVRYTKIQGRVIYKFDEQITPQMLDQIIQEGSGK